MVRLVPFFNVYSPLDPHLSEWTLTSLSAKLAIYVLWLRGACYAPSLVDSGQERCVFVVSTCFSRWSVCKPVNICLNLFVSILYFLFLFVYCRVYFCLLLFISAYLCLFLFISVYFSSLLFILDYFSLLTFYMLLLVGYQQNNPPI